jgi:hypothetical protein
MKLNDTVIAQIVKLIQMALLTGTDIVDHLRMMMLEKGENDNLVMNSEYQKVFDASIEKMLQNVNQQDLEGEEDIEQG